MWMAMFVARYTAGSSPLTAKFSANVKPVTGRPASGVLPGCASAVWSDRTCRITDNGVLVVKDERGAQAVGVNECGSQEEDGDAPREFRVPVPIIRRGFATTSGGF